MFTVGVEALGARRMVGVAGNLAAALDERYRRQGYEHSGASFAQAITEDAARRYELIKERLTTAI